MKSSDTPIDSALLMFFRDLKRAKEGDRLTLARISKAWSQGRMTQEDLFETLARMYDEGLPKAIPASENLRFAKTAEGTSRIAMSLRRPKTILSALSGLIGASAPPKRQMRGSLVAERRLSGVV